MGVVGERAEWWRRGRRALTGGAGYRVDCLDEQRCVALRILHKHQQQLQGGLYHQAGLGEKAIHMSGAWIRLLVPGGGAGPKEKSLGRKILVLDLDLKVPFSLQGPSGLPQPFPIHRRGN